MNWQIFKRIFNYQEGVTNVLFGQERTLKAQGKEKVIEELYNFSYKPTYLIATKKQRYNLRIRILTKYSLVKILLSSCSHFTMTGEVFHLTVLFCGAAFRNHCSILSPHRKMTFLYNMHLYSLYFNYQVTFI